MLTATQRDQLLAALDGALTAQQKADLLAGMLTAQQRDQVLAALDGMLTAQQKADLLAALEGALTAQQKADVLAGMLTAAQRDQLLAALESALTVQQKNSLLAALDGALTAQQKAELLAGMLTVEQKADLLAGMLTPDQKADLLAALPNIFSAEERAALLAALAGALSAQEKAQLLAAQSNIPTPPQKAALDHAHAPGADNPFATLGDLGALRVVAAGHVDLSQVAPPQAPFQLGVVSNAADTGLATLSFLGYAPERRHAYHVHVLPINPTRVYGDEVGKMALVELVGFDATGFILHMARLSLSPLQAGQHYLGPVYVQVSEITTYSPAPLPEPPPVTDPAGAQPLQRGVREPRGTEPFLGSRAGAFRYYTVQIQAEPGSNAGAETTLYFQFTPGDLSDNEVGVKLYRRDGELIGEPVNTTGRSGEREMAMPTAPGVYLAQVFNYRPDIDLDYILLWE